MKSYVRHDMATNNVTSSDVSHLFPRLCAVGLASTVDGALVLAEMNQRDRQTSKVGHVVVQQLSSVVHFVVKTTVGHLTYTSQTQQRSTTDHT